MTLSLKRQGNFTASNTYPSDSQLSKLGSLEVGWSTISSKSNVYQTHFHMNDGCEYYCTLTQEEIETIESVIHKASVVEAEEQLRHKQLFDSHRSLLSKATGNGDTSCVLCAVHFKESRQKIYGCHDCGKKMCFRCKVNYSLKQSTKVLLCRMCCSRRELWKKTGAWFDGQLLACTIDPDKSPSLCSLEGELEDVFFRREVIGNSEPDSSSSDIEDNVSSPKNYMISQTSTEDIPVQIMSTPPTPMKFAARPNQKAASMSPLPSSNKLSPWFDQCLLTPEKARCPVASRLSKSRERMFQRQASVDEPDYQSDVKSPPATPEKGSPYASDVELHQARSVSLPPRSSPTPSSKFKKSGTYRSDSTWSNMSKSRSLPFASLKRSTTTDSYGTIDFTMQYNKETAELNIKILRCQGLPPADTNGLSDPYVVMYLSFSPKHTKRSTKVICANLNPVFNEEKVYHGITPANIRHSDLILLVYDYDVISKDDFLGATSLPLRRVLHEDITTFQLPFKNQYPALMHVAGGDSKGQVLVTLKYCTSSAALIVRIVKVARLDPIQTSTTANPYVKVYLLQDKSIELKRKTTVALGTLNPEFNEDIYIPVDLKKLHTCQLKIAVWHYNKSKRNIPIGSATLTQFDSTYEVLGNALSSPNIASREWITLS